MTLKNYNGSNDKLTIQDKEFSSRLMLGTGKYKTLFLTQESIEASKTEIVTVAIRRLNSNDLFLSNNSNLITSLNWKKIMVTSEYSRGKNS